MNDAGLAGRIVALEEHSEGLRAREVFVLIGGTGLEDTDEVLEGALACGYGLGGANGIGHVTFKFDTYLFRLFGDGEVGFTRDTGLDLNEVDPSALEHVHSVASVLRCGDGNGGFVVGFGTVEHGTRDNHARSEDAVRGYVIAGLEDGVEGAAHIADAGDTVGEEERKDKVGTVGGSAIEVDVGVHIPEARNEVLALGVDDLACFGISSGGVSDAGDAIAVDDHGGVGLNFAVGDVDEGCVSNGEGLRLCAGHQKGQEEKELLEDRHRVKELIGCYFAAM